MIRWLRIKLLGRCTYCQGRGYLLVNDGRITCERCLGTGLGMVQLAERNRK